MIIPQGGLQLQSHQHQHSNKSSTHASSNTSTTTTFYSGVKLAPPVLSASVEQLERRASDQKIWYTIQVFPCDLTIITPAVQAATSSNGATVAGGTGTCAGVTSIPRKPYKIYRRYEDVADFADQLEEEFSGRLVAPSTTIGVQSDSKDSNAAASSAISTSGGGVGSRSYCVNGNVPGSGSMAFTEKGMLDGGTSATPSNNNASNNTNQSNGSTFTSTSSTTSSTTTVALPRLKSRLVLFVTKAVCLQRKEELDRYLQELFTLGPIIAQSRLVAEFFGIWKTDMEVHLSQEDRDPLALHFVTAMTTIFDHENNKNGSSSDQDHDYGHGDGHETDNREDANGDKKVLQDGPTSAGFPVSHTTMMDSPSPSTLTASSPSPPPPIPSANHVRALEAHSTYKSRSLSTVNPTSSSTNAQHPSTAASTKTMESTYLASPSLSPSPSAYESQDIGWTPSLTTPSLATQPPLPSQPGNDVDSEMASPIESSMPAPFVTTHLGPITDGYESGAGTETETISDLTTRTIKKFKSLRRAHTSSHNRQQQQQDSNSQEDSHPGLPVRSGSISGPSGGGVPTAPTTPSKTKIMMRSKTIVFRPEVTMQPLSSKNVIPPWNRIPSFTSSTNANNSTSNNNSGTAPISPISPTTPHSVATMSLSSAGSTPNTGTSEHNRAASPISFDVDDQSYQQQPRKLTMSHSKTMSSISTTPSWSFGNNGSSAASTDHSSFAQGSLAGLSSSAMSTNSSNSSGASTTSGNRNGSICNTSARSMSISSGMAPTTLVAPWNRVNANGETNTHLHSLIKISGQTSPSLQSPMMNSPFVPVELGRSFHKKESQAQRSPSNRGNKDRAVPVLTQPPEARNRNLDSTSLALSSGSSGPSGGGMKGRARKPGMTHSVSAPGGFLPVMTVSAPDSSSSSPPNKASGARSTEDVSGAPVKATVTKKRVSLHSPSLTAKQPVGILKNAQRGTRKASLTVPGAVMFPVQPSSTSLAAAAAAGSALSLVSPSTPTPAGGTHGAGTLATTFKIVMDADTIVALQVLEDSSFVLTMPELRSRVKAKLTKSNIQLPDKFDLLWTAPTNSMTLVSPSPLPSPSPSTPTSGMSSMSIHQSAAVAAALDQGVMLKTDEDLHRAIHASRNHKVTLRCII
ncbi:hypothetical protein EC991_000908 [Linnemannia zychae]|nr:hypothetical protein EC991_000908 [Linnemannia zychae]